MRELKGFPTFLILAQRHWKRFEGVNFIVSEHPNAST